MAFDESKKADVIQSFNNIEKSILDFLKILPYSNNNLKAWSPALAPVILDCGSLIDSIFRSLAPPRKTVRGRIWRRKDFDINDFRQLYSRKHNLINLRTLLYVSPPKLLNPFGEWSNSRSPYWWKDYNKIKHDRIANVRLATLGTAIEIASALFEVISQDPRMVEILSRYDWLKLGDWNPDFILPELKSKQKIKRLNDTFIIETQLFVTTIGKNVFPNSVNSITPLSYKGGTKLARFLNKWM